MSSEYFDSITFQKEDFTVTEIQRGNYDTCHFDSCNFSGVDLSGISFAACTFVNCNLSNALLGNTAFKDAQFTDCKLLGLHFNDCNDFLFEVTYTNCTLDFSTFFQRKMKKTAFTNCSLIEVDFSESDLTQSVFKDCDLNGAVFDNTIIEKADFTSARNYSIHPDKNYITKAKFSLPAVIGLLDAYNIDVRY
jgi:fluoroquinolone resistance protein